MKLLPMAGVVIGLVRTTPKSGKSTERQSLSRNSANDTSRIRIMG